jgi:hypothetical protein
MHMSHTLACLCVCLQVHTLEDTVERLTYRANKAESGATAIRRKMVADSEAYAGGMHPCVCVCACVYIYEHVCVCVC